MNENVEGVMVIVAKDGEMSTLSFCEPLHELITDTREDLEYVGPFEKAIVTEEEHYLVDIIEKVLFITEHSIYCLKRTGPKNFEKEVLQ